MAGEGNESLEWRKALVGAFARSVTAQFYATGAGSELFEAYARASVEDRESAGEGIREAFLEKWHKRLQRYFEADEEGLKILQEMAKQSEAEGRSYAASLCMIAKDMLSGSPGLGIR